MILRRYRYVFAFAIACMLVAPRAGAFSMTLGGPEPESVSPSADLSSTIWAGAAGGAVVKIAAVGMPAPGGGTFTEMGVPSISPESQVIFGAEVTDPSGVARWEIFRGDLNAPPDRRVTPAIEKAAASPGCVPKMKLDPYPVAGSNGDLAFIAPEAAGSDALFRYANGELSCAVRLGDRTAQGHVLKVMHFGSAVIAPSGEVAFIGRIYEAGTSPRRGTRLATMLATQHGPIREVAVEGSRSAGGSRYLGGFGLPAVVSTRNGPVVAFTATISSRSNSRGSNSRSYGLYVYRGGKTIEALASGDHSPI
jgi:hypothetical protein